MNFDKKWWFAGGVIVFALLGLYWWSGDEKTGPGMEGDREVLYWVAPMDPHYKSDEPGKSPMGMDLIPVYEENRDTGPSTVKLSDRQRVLADVETLQVRRSRAIRKIRTTGRVTYDDRNVESVTAWFPGRIETLHADFPGDTIEQGQPMAEIYSPELITAQREYLSTRGNPSLRKSSRQKLKYWGISDRQIDQLERTGQPRSTMTVNAPRSGTIIKQSVKEGQYVKEGTTLFEIADYGSLWLKMDIFQQNSPWVKEGQSVRVESPEHPGRSFEAPIEFIDPFYNESLRATQARATMTDPPDWVVPGKYLIAYLNVPLDEANVEGLTSDTRGRVTVVPKEAVIHTGERSVVYIQNEPGQFEARNITVGPLARIPNYNTAVYPVVSGLKPGEQVVQRGNFLIDSQSRVGSGGGGYSGALGDNEEGGGHNH